MTLRDILLRRLVAANSESGLPPAYLEAQHPRGYHGKWIDKYGPGKPGPFHERKERRARKTGRDPNARIAYTAEHVARIANEFSSWKDWYDECQSDLVDLFDGSVDLFKKILGATSQAATVKSNVGLAIKAYRQMIRGEEFTGYLGGVKRNLERIRQGLTLEGPKIGEYGKAVEGEQGIAIDRHVFQLLYHTTGNRPSAKQIDDAKKLITDLASKLGWKPQQLQATLWAAHIIKQGKMPETYHDRLKELKHAGQIDDITGR